MIAQIASTNAPAHGGLRLRSSEEWDKYFAGNDEQLIPVPWEQGAGASDAELTEIAASLQGFQLGESSEGFHLIKRARQYSQRNDDPLYVSAIERFIREEQRHARDLGKFLDLAGIPRIKSTWPDTVFRKLRHGAGLELSIAVLVTAEIIAKVYYPALREATGSAVLRTICDQIIRDEAPHVEFQTERLAILRRKRGGAYLTAAHALQRFLFWGTCYVVWIKHGRTLRAGGYSYRKFRQECWREYNDARKRMDPRSYVD